MAIARPPRTPDDFIIEWKIIGTQENFTILGMSQDNKIYFWKDQKWNLL